MQVALQKFKGKKSVQALLATTITKKLKILDRLIILILM